ncbi:MAG: RNA polymerase sigma factor [Saprospirales bacterium]|nr:RNA polymerase sigma factor [Saprospirales bacterium]MBK8492819.1 RNA polymerase sigma factor [Saprospirales bacterium]
MPELNDILEACKRGERLAQRQLYDLYKGKLFAVCLRYADNRQDAEDMLQEGFIQVFKDLHQYKMLGSFEGWMRKVVLNVSLQYLRRQKRQVPTSELGQSEEPDSDQEDQSLFSEDMVQLVLQYIQKMPAGFRTVLNLYVMEGYTHEQIAQTLGISEGTSKSQLSRAKVYLKNMLDKALAS